MSSKAVASAEPADLATSGLMTGPPRSLRQALAAWLLVLSVAIHVVGFGLVLSELVPFAIWAPIQAFVPPLASVASLILGNRRKLWVKLNYLVLGFWLLQITAGLVFLSLIATPG